MAPDQQPDTKRLGNHMIIAAWIGVLGLLTWFFSGYLDQQYNPNQSLQSSSGTADNEVVLDRNRYGHYVAPGRINDVPVTFLLDTGATVVSIPGDLADRLALQRGGAIQVMTANGVVQAYATVLDQVQLGTIVLENVRATINPQMYGDEVLLGMSFLKQLDFSQQGEQITIRQQGR